MEIIAYFSSVWILIVLATHIGVVLSPWLCDIVFVSLFYIGLQPTQNE